MNSQVFRFAWLDQFRGWLPVLVGVCLPSLFLAACTGPPEPPRQPITLRIGVAAGLGVPQFVNGYLTGESLTSVGWNGRPVPALASDWKWSSDRLSLHLRLHPDIRFHDGTPLDAPLARDLLKRVLNPEANAFSVSLESIKRIEATEPLGLTLQLSRPEAFLLEDLANSTLPHPTTEGIGTGPFRRIATAGQGSNAADASITRLEAFDEYYRGRPTIDLMEVRSYDEQRSAWAALMRGDIDAVHEVNPNAIDFVEAQTTVRTFSVVRPYYIALWFNLRHPVLKDSWVRKALSYAVNRQQLIEQGLKGRGEASQGPVWPYHWAYTPAERSYALNREAATIQLDAAGYSPRDSPNGMRRRFRFSCLTLAGDRYETLALLLQRQLYEIGVDMQIDAVPYGEVMKRLQSGNFETLLLERSSGRSLTWTYTTFHSRSTPGGYASADHALDELRGATTEEGVRDALSQFHRVLYDDPPAIFLAWPTVARAVRTTFVVPDEPGRDVMTSLRLWRPAAGPQ